MPQIRGRTPVVPRNTVAPVVTERVRVLAEVPTPMLDDATPAYRR